MTEAGVEPAAHWLRKCNRKAGVVKRIAEREFSVPDTARGDGQRVHPKNAIDQSFFRQ